jgi:hypothetical protein
MGWSISGYTDIRDRSMKSIIQSLRAYLAFPTFDKGIKVGGGAVYDAGSASIDFTSPVTIDGRAAWTDYTPTLTATTTNPTLGTGAVQLASYSVIGETVFYYGTIRFGTSGTAAGSGTYEVSLPVDHAATLSSLDEPILGQFRIRDQSSAAELTNGRGYAVTSAGLDRIQLFYQSTYNSALSAITHAAPWAWAASDIIQWSIVYPGDV